MIYIHRRCSLIIDIPGFTRFYLIFCIVFSMLAFRSPLLISVLSRLPPIDGVHSDEFDAHLLGHIFVNQSLEQKSGES